MAKKWIVSFAVLSLLICTVGGTVAYLITATGPVTNTFIPGEADGEIVEAFENNEKEAIKIKNNGTVDAYFRVKLISYYFAKGSDVIIAKDSWFDENAWKNKADNGWFYHDGYYYYPERIAPNNETLVLFDETIELTEDTAGNRQVLEILAEAIQADPKDAVEDAWPVIVGTNGNLSIKTGN